MSKEFTKAMRLRTQSDFRQVFAARQSAADAVLIVYARKNQLHASRLGACVSRKVGNAVIRNRWKRRIREAFRLHVDQLPCGFDFVVLPNRRARPEFAPIRQSLLRLTERASRGKMQNNRTQDGKDRYPYPRSGQHSSTRLNKNGAEQSP